MIFRPELAEAILDGRKTVTRRPVKLVPRLRPDGWNGRRDGMEPLPSRYRVGHSYAVQPGRGQKAIGRIVIHDVEMQLLGAAFTKAEARAEGFPHPDSLRRYWSDLYGTDWGEDDLVWRIRFELDPAPQDPQERAA